MSFPAPGEAPGPRTAMLYALLLLFALATRFPFFFTMRLIGTNPLSY